jgi:hypothetical protein
MVLLEKVCAKPCFDFVLTSMSDFFPKKRNAREESLSGSFVLKLASQPGCLNSGGEGKKDC